MPYSFLCILYILYNRYFIIPIKNKNYLSAFKGKLFHMPTINTHSIALILFVKI